MTVGHSSLSANDGKNLSCLNLQEFLFIVDHYKCQPISLFTPSGVWEWGGNSSSMWDFVSEASVSFVSLTLLFDELSGSAILCGIFLNGTG